MPFRRRRPTRGRRGYSRRPRFFRRRGRIARRRVTRPSRIGIRM